MSFMVIYKVLLKVDRASMAHGVEVRVPFLDRRIIDFSALISPSLEFHIEIKKHLLKNILKVMSQKIIFLVINKDFHSI